jgi:hypothetical protein
MANGDSYTHEKVRRLCRDISDRADDPAKLQTLAVRLQQALREEERYQTAAVKSAPLDNDDPFDKIMVA